MRFFDTNFGFIIIKFQLEKFVIFLIVVLERLDLNSVQTEEQNTENSSEDEIKRIPNQYATLVKKDNHDLPDADDNKEYDKLFKLGFLLFIFFPHIIDLKLASQLYHCRIPNLIQDSNVITEVQVDFRNYILRCLLP
jgi:hypothetical protein